MSPGPASYLMLLNTSFLDYIQSGEVFSEAPRVAVYDVGGNLVTSDSRSQIQATLVGVSSDVYLSPVEALSVRLVNGLATFGELSINKAGTFQAIEFELFSYSFFPHNYTTTNILLRTPLFTTYSGPPAEVSMAVRARRAWAGGQVPLTFTTLHFHEYYCSQ